jgi:hypothetical protein
MPKTRRVLLADGPPTEELLGELDRALERVAGETEVTFGDPQIEQDDGVTTRAFAEVSDKGHTLTFVDDPRAGRRVVVTGRRAAAIAGVLADALPAERPEDLVELASEGRDPRAIVRVALAAAPGAEGIVVTALRSTDAEQIDAGITAAAMTDPSLYEGDLHRLATEALDAGLRLMAEQALAGGGRG